MVKEDVFCLVTQRSMHVDKSLPRWTTRGSLVSWDSITISSVCIRCWVVHPGHATMLSKAVENGQSCHDELLIHTRLFSSARYSE